MLRLLGFRRKWRRRDDRGGLEAARDEEESEESSNVGDLLCSLSISKHPFFLHRAVRPSHFTRTQLLILLCFTSGIFSGLRGCCFGITNTILVKRMREMLYNALLYQDMSFFDEETVGDLTSRLGADCQQVSQVIGYDLNLICRNVLQVLYNCWGSSSCEFDKDDCASSQSISPHYKKQKQKESKCIIFCIIW